MNVVITGSTRGLGFELAEQFIKRGHSVLINSRDRMKCAEISGKLRSLYANCIIHIYACDVTCFNSVERMFWEANRYFGSVDIWINNAGSSLDLLEIKNGTNVAIAGMKDKGGRIYNIECRKNKKTLTSYSKDISKDAIEHNTKIYVINPKPLLIIKKAPFLTKGILSERNGALIKCFS